MNQALVLALDAMGGDHGPSVVVNGAAQAVKDAPEAKFLLFGDKGQIQPLLETCPDLAANCEIRHTEKHIAMDERPATALRNSRGTSMRMALEAVQQGEAHCMISAGNTGALMALSKTVLKLVEGIDRPAIASVFPTRRGETVVLDLGANAECDARILAQFAVMGTVYAQLVMGVESPTIGVLNIGVEDVKGNDEVRAAHAILSRAEFPGRYVGFIEGDDIPLGKVDVAVTDGFTGNIALKIAEGTGKLIGGYIKEAFSSTVWSKIGYLLASRAFRRLKEKVDPRRYNGGVMLGLNGICIKSHGGTDAFGFAHAIHVGARMARLDIVDRQQHDVAQLIAQKYALNAAAHDRNGGGAPAASAQEERVSVS